MTAIDAPVMAESTLPARRIGVVCAATIALFAGVLAAIAAWKSTYAILGRDQGIYQYVAWALGQGQRDYVDIREFNGPLIRIIHLAFLHLGGADEHIFRLLDVLLSSAVFFATGVLIAGKRRERWLWGAATFAVLMAQYVQFGWWQTGQRESFYDLFLLLAIGLQMYSPKSSIVALSGLLSGLTWFGKPTSVLFTVLQAALLLRDPDRRRLLIAFGAGCVAACAVMLGFVAATGSIGAWIRLGLLEVPAVYKWVWKTSWGDCMFMWGNWQIVLPAIATLGAVLLLARRDPRLLPLAILPAGGLIVFFFQAKGFPYHLHPVAAGMHLAWLGIVMWGVDRWRPRWTLVCSAVLALGCCWEMWTAPVVEHSWYKTGQTAEARRSEEYLAQFPWGDFFARDLRHAADFLQANTAPADRVQTYGMDPYLLFLARRVSATPFIYSFDFNVDSAIEGGSGGKPTAAQAANFQATARQHEATMLAALEKSPPAAFALIDRAPYTNPASAEADFAEHCPHASAFMRARYRKAARFGTVHVWLRNDLPVRAP